MNNDSGVMLGLNLRSLLENADLLHTVTASSRVNGGSQTNKNEGEKDNEDSWGMVDAHAAFLGPSLWDNSDLKPRVSPTDLTKKLMEYMDLDEFLSENGIPLTETEVNPSAPTSPSTSSTSGGNNESDTRATGVPNKPLSPVDLLDSETVSSVASSCGSMRNAVTPAAVSMTPRSGGAGKRRGRQPVALESEEDDEDDEDVPVRKTARKVDDLALASVPGQNFDPRSRTFSEEELRPQPMVKKSKKQYVPDEQKDEKYWSRRQKNNLAAKRSRDARRTKENQIIMRASFLERENSSLKAQLEKMKKENGSLKQRLQKYERV